MGLFSPPRITFDPVDYLEGDAVVEKIKKTKNPSSFILGDETDPEELIERWDAILRSEGH